MLPTVAYPPGCTSVERRRPPPDRATAVTRASPWAGGDRRERIPWAEQIRRFAAGRLRSLLSARNPSRRVRSSRTGLVPLRAAPAVATPRIAPAKLRPWANWVRAAVRDTSIVGKLTHASSARPDAGQIEVSSDGAGGALAVRRPAPAALLPTPRRGRASWRCVSGTRRSPGSSSASPPATVIALEAHQGRGRAIICRSAVRIVGFDMGSGLPRRSTSVTSLPLEGRLLRNGRAAAAVAADQLDAWCSGRSPRRCPRFMCDPPVEAPVGMISFDLDYYSSTVVAFDIFNCRTMRSCRVGGMHHLVALPDDQAPGARRADPGLTWPTRRKRSKHGRAGRSTSRRTAPCGCSCSATWSSSGPTS